jgi:hypothetical protein
MKTSKFKTIKMENRTYFLSMTVMGILLILIAGCRKEDDLTSASNKNILSNERTGNPDAGSGDPAFILFKTDHQAGKSSLPDYVVTVFSDGNIVYQGRKNVAAMGKVQFRVSDSTLQRLGDLAFSYGIEQETSFDSDPRNLVPECPRYFISFARSVDKPLKTFVSYSDLNPATAEQAAQIVDNILQSELALSSLIYGNNVVNDPPSDAPLVYPVINIVHEDGLDPIRNYFITVFSNDSAVFDYSGHQSFAAVGWRGRFPHSTMLALKNEFEKCQFASMNDDPPGWSAFGKITTTWSPDANSVGKRVMFYNNGTRASLTVLTTTIESILVNKLFNNHPTTSKRPHILSSRNKSFSP